MDRLRRLDAMFAEKVLGCKVIPDRWGCDDIACGCDHSPHNGGNDDPSGLVLLYYTRSLDAVWEATNNDKFCCRNVDGDYSYVYKAFVSKHHDPDSALRDTHDRYYGQSESHPAEALVLACLRAVGVTEEKLK